MGFVYQSARLRLNRCVRVFAFFSILALVIALAVSMTCLLDAFSVTVLMMSTVECIVDEIYFQMIRPSTPPLGNGLRFIAFIYEVASYRG